ncbi:DNA/RNA helicase domain-containing protein [Haladaptatus sp. GCM10025707]|uniref:DNA/RNA helicase domain-containing protein n=1 Tax=Haladaptatus sp. GCM10025707 TaxID=3252658 RepID=UPI003607B741
MLVYENTKSGFLEDSLTDQLVPEIKRGYESKGLGMGSESEVRSWENSFQYMHKVLSGSSLPDDAGVAIEFKIPLTSRRIDFLISGYDAAENANVAIVELKQWDGPSTEAVEDKDGIVRTLLGGGIRETTHPSYQASSYAQLLKDFNTRIQDKPIHLYPAAYLHNFEPAHRETPERDVYRRYTDEAPLFVRGDAKKLRSFLESQIEVGDNLETLYELNDGKLRPAKSLQDSLLAMLEDRDEFTLIDSQKVVFEKAVELAKRSARDGQKRVLIVDGGPGTGKTVVAINILSELIQQDLVAQYVSKNRAPREVYKQKLRGDKLVKEIDHLFTGAGSFVETASNALPALIADEAHRLNAESTFFGRGENQIMEIINAAKFSVFFIDESQRIHIDDIGSKAEIRRHARDLGAEIEEVELDSQFRCNGSEGYIAWLNDVLEIRATANADGFDLDYDLQVFDTPQALHDAIARKNEHTRLSRVVAGYCWEWDKEGRSDPDAYDIKIGEYERSWNLDTSEPWAIAEGSIDEVGCIHTCQGLEFDYVGVIIGADLKYREGEIVVDHEARANTDRSLFGIKKMFREEPEKAAARAEELIKNTYRTLMSRGMKGCYIYCCDEQLQEYLKTRLATGSAEPR